MKDYYNNFPNTFPNRNKGLKILEWFPNKIIHDFR